MIPLLLVVGSLIPASDSAELTTAPPPPSAAGAFVDVRDLIRPGMGKDEVERLLGNATTEGGIGAGAGGRNVSGYQEYARLGLWVVYTYERVSKVTRVKPKK
jgi:hypothetical protein